MPQWHAAYDGRGQLGSHVPDTGVRFGVVLGARRRAVKLTQAELAARAGVGLGTVRDLEQGRTGRPSPESVNRLAGVLGLDLRSWAELAGSAVEIAPNPQAARSQVAGDAGLRGGCEERACRLWIQVLGPLQVRRLGRPVRLGAAKKRMLLGLLAVAANTLVHRETLIDAVWGQDPPATAVSLVQAYVSRLRRALDPGRSPRDPAGLLVAVGAGYRLQVSAGQLDLLAFTELAGRGRAAGSRGAAAEACTAYEQALGMWHGELLADIDALRRHPAVLEAGRRRAAVICDYADAACAAGIPDRVLAHLRELAASEPLDEKAHAQLMIALAACGQQAAALEVYEDLRHRLDDQLGVRPGPELAEAHLRVLRQEIPAATPALTARMDRPAAGEAAPVVPRQLPGAVPHFAGRAAELAKLTSLLESAAAAGTVVISAIGGTAGVGKTALAVHWAHRVAERFPDGHMYVNLRGFDPGGTPVTPEQAVRGFLDGLAVPAGRVPAGLEAQVGLYRSLTAGKRMLILLDNARDEQQVRPLLPGTPTCLVVVTSRCHLTGLITTAGACPLTLDVFSESDARELLARRLGAERAAGEPSAVPELTELCARLPLALSVAAARAAASPGLRLADLAAELRDARGRLDALDDGDAATSVRAVFSWSYQQLTPAASRMFRLLGLHPGPDFSTPAAASLAAVPPSRARALMRELTRVHLLSEPVLGRFAFHDLLRAYASEQAHACDSDGERRAALTGLFDYCLATAAAAVDVLIPAERHRLPRVPAPATPVPPMAAPAAARAWLDAERAGLVAIAAHAAAQGWPGHSTRLAAVLFTYLDVGGHYTDAWTVHTHALRAARQVGDRAAQATELMRLGIMSRNMSRYEEAADHYQQALELYRELGDRLGQARTLDNLSLGLWSQGRYQEAADRLRPALALFVQLGDRLCQAHAHSKLGLVGWRQGRHQEAIDHHQQALSLFRELRHREGEAASLDNLGLILCLQGHHQQAADCHQQALAIFCELGHRYGEAQTLSDLGLLLRRQGHYRQAAVCHRQALAFFREIGDRSGVADALNGLGEALSAGGQTGQARAQHLDALTVACQIGDRYGQARAHDGLARTHAAAGGHHEARHHWQQALAVYSDLGVPEASEVSAKLGGLDGLPANALPGSA